MPLLYGSVFCAGIHEIFVKLMKKGGREGKGGGRGDEEREKGAQKKEKPLKGLFLKRVRKPVSVRTGTRIQASSFSLMDLLPNPTYKCFLKDLFSFSLYLLLLEDFLYFY